MSDDTKWEEAGGSFPITQRWTEEPKSEWEKENTQFLGAALEGVYKKVETGIGSKDATVYLLETEAHGLVNVFGATVLTGKMEQVPLNNKVRIEYLGLKKGKSGNEYNDFKVQFAPAPMKEAVADAL